MLKSYGTGSGSVVVKAVSKAKPALSVIKEININTPFIINSFKITSYTNIYSNSECFKGNGITFAGYTLPAKVNLSAEYYDPSLTVPGIIPYDLLTYKITANPSVEGIPTVSKSGYGWELKFNNTAGVFTIIGFYASGTTTVTSSVRATQKANLNNFVIIECWPNPGTQIGSGNDLSESNSLSLAPIPNQGSFNVQSYLRNEYELTDITGCIVKKGILEKGNNPFIVDCPKGVYILSTGRKKYKILIQ